MILKGMNSILCRLIVSYPFRDMAGYLQSAAQLFFVLSRNAPSHEEFCLTTQITAVYQTSLFISPVYFLMIFSRSYKEDEGRCEGRGSCGP